MPAVKGAVFVSYSHKDKKVKDEIVSHLSATPALRGNVFWTDGQIPPGSEWLPQIAENLVKAQVALLLVSQNYLDSKFITRNELQPFLERARHNLVKILWIPIGACASYKKKHLAEFQSAWEATEPLERLAELPVARSAVLDKIAETIREALYPNEDFMGFFGDKCLEDAHPAVFLDGELPQLIGTRLSMVKLSHPPREKISGEQCQHCELPLKQALPFDIHQIVPFRELNAVLKLDREFRNFSRHGIKVSLDSEYSQALPERGCICLGLGFNELTRRLGELSGAYEVYFEPGQTDHFKIRGWDNDKEQETDWLDPENMRRTHLSKGSAGAGRSVKGQYALIARILLPKHEGVPHVVVAGHTADGTEAACTYLVKYWREIWKDTNYQKYVRDHHMAAVLDYDGHAENFRKKLKHAQFLPVDWDEPRRR